MNLSDYAFGERSGGYTVSKPKPAAFYFHYDEAASLTAGEPRLSIHYRDQYLIVKGVECRVPVKFRTRKTQPRCVMSGKARSINVRDSIAVIT